MLEIIDNMTPFFEDCYRRISVREYSRIIKVAPPTASKMLSVYASEGLLIKERYKNYLFFHAKKDSKDFIGLSRVYWQHKLKDLGAFLDQNLANPVVILFGSLSKGEAKADSDVDIAIFAVKKPLKLDFFEKKIKRKLQIFWFKSGKDIKNKDLANNILNGHIIVGRISI